MVEHLSCNRRTQGTLEQLAEASGFPLRVCADEGELVELLVACGAEVSEGRGSRVRVALNGIRAVFHRSHPAKETDKGAVMSMRRFLTEAGIQP